MVRSLRNTDRCGRWGGEEFVLLLTGVAPEQASRLLQRLAREIALARIPVPPGCAPLTVSVGYAGSSAGRPADAGTLLRQADEAMYEAKHSGRDAIIGHHQLGAARGRDGDGAPAVGGTG
ncbi:hypothetical protein CLD22_30015 [Rubrivivax gelatinosus]|nr:hypothetical protein [Rubrivivax gelatinosus]